MLDDIIQNPFPGLRAFEEEEDILFFGREKPYKKQKKRNHYKENLKPYKKLRKKNHYKGNLKPYKKSKYPRILTKMVYREI